MDKPSSLINTRATKNLHIKEGKISNGIKCGDTYYWINPDTKQAIPICTRSLEVACAIAMQFDDLFYLRKNLGSK